MHPEELPIATGDFAAMQRHAGPVDRWVILPLMRAVGQRRRDAILARGSLGDLARTILPGTDVPGLAGWECIATPGHTPGYVAYFRPRDRVLISGDALVTLQLNTVSGLLLGRQGLSGPPWYTSWNRHVAADSIRTLAELEPSAIVSGHGWPMVGDQTAMAVRAFARLLERK